VRAKTAKIAILILAHKNLSQLKRLVGHLQGDFDVFVHVDRRSEIRESDFREFSQVHVIKKFNTTWGSLGIVRATLELFRLASESTRPDRYVLISGQDVPLKNNQEILRFFQRHPDLDFVESNALNLADESLLRRIDSYHFSRTSLRSWRWLQKGPISYFLTSWAAFLSRALGRLIALSGVRRPLNYRFRWGSQWMDLKSDTVQKILEFTLHNSRFLKRFRFTHAPDEFFFQTALELCGAGRRSAVAPPSRFIDWDSGPEHPRVLRWEDLKRVEASDKLFARKCDSTIDLKLIDQLYSRLHSSP
jgi:hypothetical protein